MDTARGARIGAKIKRLTFASMPQPRISRKILIRSSTTNLLEVMEVIKAARITGTFPIATSQPTGQATRRDHSTAPD